MIGLTVSHYRILDKLGGGGMGMVYKAENIRLGNFVALKFLSEELSHDRQALERFKHEAHAASALNHPNICTIFDIDEHEGQPFIVMELLEGQTLKHRLEAGTRHAPTLTMYVLLDLAIQIADALDTAHSKGIIHRDLKPANIMLTVRGQVKILDFGLAKLAHERAAEVLASSAPETAIAVSDQNSFTRAGAAVGTPAYMSPEQVGGHSVDQRTDLFSLGSVLYEMVTRQRAFEGDSPRDILEKVLTHVPPPASWANPEVSPGFDEIIRKLLEKDRELRYQTAAGVRADLKRLKLETDSGRFGAAPGPPPLKKSRPLPFKWAVLAASVVLAVGLGVAGWYAFRRSGTVPGTLAAFPLTSYAGRENMPALSPNGTQVAFSWNGGKEDNFDIYVKLIGAETPLRLTSDPAVDFSPSWSPDGRWVAFLRCLPAGKAAVVMVPVIGGPERVLTEIFFDQNNVDGPFLAWSPNSPWLAVAGLERPGEVMALFLYSAEKGEKRWLTSPPATSRGDSCPAFSSDGRTLAFFRWASWWNSDLYVLALSPDYRPEGDPRRVTSGNWRAASPAWTAGGDALVFSAFSGGGSSLWRVAASGTSTPQRMTPMEVNAAYPATSRRGNSLAYAQSFVDYNIWRVEIPAAGGKASLPERIISSTRNEYFPQFSPDGKKIAFISERSGNQEIWVCDADGANSVQLTSLSGPTVGRARWSPDGRRLAFTATIEGHKEVYVLNASGGIPQRLTSSAAGSANPSWSSDGRWILFDTQDQKVEIQKVSAEGGLAVHVTDQAGWGPVESPDGRFIYSTRASADGPVLLRTSEEDGETKQILDSSVDGISYAVAEEGIYFIPRRDPKSGESIQFLNTSMGKIQRIVSIDKPLGFGLSVSPDHRWILFTQADQSGSDLMLAENLR